MMLINVTGLDQQIMIVSKTSKNLPNIALQQRSSEKDGS